MSPLKFLLNYRYTNDIDEGDLIRRFGKDVKVLRISKFGRYGPGVKGLSMSLSSGEVCKLTERYPGVGFEGDGAYFKEYKYWRKRK
jgi:hypothetical protein